MQNIKVYISCVEQDKEIADQLYKDLKRNGLIPWAAYKDIRPGEDKKLAMSKAIKKSDFFLALLSSSSLQRSTFHWELRQAKEIKAEIPPSEPYIIPIRLEKVEYEELERIRPVDFFPFAENYRNGVKNLLDFLKKEKKQKEEKIKKVIIQDNKKVQIPESSFAWKYLSSLIISILANIMSKVIFDAPQVVPILIKYSNWILCFLSLVSFIFFIWCFRWYKRRVTNLTYDKIIILEKFRVEKYLGFLCIFLLMTFINIILNYGTLTLNSINIVISNNFLNFLTILALAFLFLRLRYLVYNQFNSIIYNFYENFSFLDEDITAYKKIIFEFNQKLKSYINDEIKINSNLVSIKYNLTISFLFNTLLSIGLFWLFQ